MDIQDLDYSYPIPIPRGNDSDSLCSDILGKLSYSVGKDPGAAKPHDWLMAISFAVRDRVMDRWVVCNRQTWADGGKRVYYLSAEFLIGKTLINAIMNLDIMHNMLSALNRLGVDLYEISELEPDAALGNGGLGRLAACYLDSMSSLGIPAYGYGIRYQHGLFKQKILDGKQIEFPEDWLDHRNPWEYERRESSYLIKIGGRVREEKNADGETVTTWLPQSQFWAVAYDMPVVGYQGKRINTLRLWFARAVESLQLEHFNKGDYINAISDKSSAEILTQVLYPADSSIEGQTLRLKQEYFFCSASIQDILSRHIHKYKTLDNLPDKVSIQLNDTHPSISVIEFMYQLIDNYNIPFQKAWKLTVDVFSYTNHTLLPEALESWSVHLLETLLPRHMKLIYQINEMILKSARDNPDIPDELISSISLIEEEGGRKVRMGQIAFAASHKINGVSALHTELMKKTVFYSMNKLYPGRITNKTNGITPRTWLAHCNPKLYSLYREVLGKEYMMEFESIKELEPYAKDASFKEKFHKIKEDNKLELVHLIKNHFGDNIDPSAVFDIQVKRIHEYKRQLLNILETVALYHNIKANPSKNWVPRVKIFGGKAAASYFNAKLIINLINDVAERINNDSSIKNLLKVYFLEDYKVSMAQIIIPATDLSEQISTAGMEASGTGNMKFALNGALTIGTLDGANVEMKERIGDDNIFIFGMNAEEVKNKRESSYNPMDFVSNNNQLSEVLESIQMGLFSQDSHDKYSGLIDELKYHDWFMNLADFSDYYNKQRELDTLWTNKELWVEKTILNSVNMGWFSSDRSIREYAEEIWNVPVST